MYALNEYLARKIEKRDATERCHHVRVEYWNVLIRFLKKQEKTKKIKNIFKFLQQNGVFVCLIYVRAELRPRKSGFTV